MSTVINGSSGVNIDTSTGVASIGTDASAPVVIKTGGSERMRIDTSGNVGIGTNNPQNQIHIEGSAVNMLRFKHTLPANYLTMGQDSTGNLRLLSDGATKLYLNADGGVSSVGGGGLGYGTGAGGTVTQATSKSTAVTLNKPTGQITMNNAALGAGAVVSFQLTNNLIGSYDVVIVQASGDIPVSNQNYSVRAHPFSGGAVIFVKNESAGSLSDAVLIKFAIIKGANA